MDVGTAAKRAIASARRRLAATGTGARCSTRSARSPRRPSARSPSASRPTRSSTPATGRRRRSATSSRATRSSRSSARDAKIEAPRGTHDILPSEQPLWQRVTGEMERLCALYGYRPHPDARLRGHRALHAHVRRGLRRRPEGDVHVRRPRRPLADAAPGGHRADLPRVLEHGLHREPQPHEALHDRADVPLRPPAARAATASTGSSRSRRSAPTIPAIDAEIIQLYDTLLAPPRRHDVPAPAQLDRRPRLPARVSREAERLARRARGRARRDARRSARRARSASST